MTCPAIYLQALAWRYYGKGTGKNVREILCCNELSGLNEDSPVVSPHQASLCCGPWWDLMKEPEVKNIKWQNC